jgi:heme exporter protein D
MDWMTDRGNVALMLAVTYVAVMTLVRMMVRRRDQVVADVEQQLETHRKQQAKAKSAKPKKSRDAA